MKPSEMVNHAIELWCEDKPLRTCAVNYEIGDSGTPHMHMVLEDPAKVRFTAIQKLYKGIHVEPTRGSKEQAEDYINKRGSFEEKNHTVVIPAVYRGEIKANKGNRKDLDVIQELLEQGKSPNEIMDMSIHFRKYETMIRKHFYRIRQKEMELVREVKVYWHIGESGSGKSFTYTKLCEEHGRDSVYLLNDYENGGFDNYCGEAILFMDEFKGNMQFQKLLNYLDVYPTQVHCRYANAYALWTEVHITSVFPPEEAYRFMVDEEMQSTDKIIQLKRRIGTMVYHYREGSCFQNFELPMSQYENYEQLRKLAENNGFIPVPEYQQGMLPFDC